MANTISNLAPSQTQSSASHTPKSPTQNKGNAFKNVSQSTKKNAGEDSQTTEERTPLQRQNSLSQLYSLPAWMWDEEFNFNLSDPKISSLPYLSFLPAMAAILVVPISRPTITGFCFCMSLSLFVDVMFVCMCSMFNVLILVLVLYFLLFSISLYSQLA